MATFFHGAPEIQSDSLQTLYLMNPGYVGYPETPAPANMVLLNSTINSINPMGLSQAQQPQHLVGVPLQTTDAGRQPSSSNVSAIQGLVPRLHYNLWAQASPPTNRASTIQQGLSLSLSPHQAPYQYQRSETEVQAPVVPDISPASADDARGASVTTASVLLASNGMSGLQSVLMGSKYLKVAQQLLDEVASVGKGARDEAAAAAGVGGSSKSPMKSSRDPEGSGEGEMSNKRGADLTTAERQELQMKKAKLVSMLDEVEQRYRQYHHQMQIVVSSFEAVAGPGSARTYTALALQTISRQFRCLRDAISGQVRATSKSLGEDDSLAGSKSEGGSRLRFVDHQLRQQRALQQLGMMQHNAWRPQRGLPERSVSILRAWLFEHFLHPYPKDSDKLMLAKQTGLTRSQVSNWFINARVRIWKPMVEEMYLEETKEHEQSNVDEKASKSEANENSASKSTTRQDDSPTITDQAESIKTNRDKLHDHLNPQNPPPIMVHPSSVLGIARNPASYHDRDAFLQPKLKNARTSAEFLDAELKSNQELLAKLGDARPISGDHGYALFAGGTSHAGGFGAYQVGEFGRFDAEQFTPRFAGNGGVALTLGLPHCDNLTLSGAQPTYLSSESVSLGRRLEMSTEASDYCNLNGSSNNQAMAHPSNAYESIAIHQSRKRFAARLLPDFVA